MQTTAGWSAAASRPSARTRLAFSPGRSLDLPLAQLAERAARVDLEGPHQRRQIERARERIGDAEGQHERNQPARILEREAVLGNAVALGLAARQVMNIARAVDLALQGALAVSPLLTLEDAEPVVGEEAPGGFEPG